LIDFTAYKGKTLLEVGCGVGIDLARFAQAGVVVTGIDLSSTAIGLARQNIQHKRLKADLCVMNGEVLDFAANTFDVVYAHGVLQYTADAKKMISEIHRVLKPGGVAILMVYNKFSWLNLLRKWSNVPLEHEDAPVLNKYSIKEFKQLLSLFTRYRIVSERFPVKTRLHGGWKAKFYNGVFVNTFNHVPKRLVKPFGWHLMAFAIK
jgi:ubiquinone/menaquinone biosynthesis C-methylase UbiE